MRIRSARCTSIDSSLSRGAAWSRTARVINWRQAMRISFTFGADPREAQGKGASRRLRHSGKVPAILYGGHKEAQALVLDQQNLLTMISDERFYSSIVQLKISNGTQQEAIIKDVQMHPAKNVVV